MSLRRRLPAPLGDSTRYSALTRYARHRRSSLTFYLYIFYLYIFLLLPRALPSTVPHTTGEMFFSLYCGTAWDLARIYYTCNACT